MDASPAYPHALALLRRAASPAGFLASPDPHANYQRVWARDGVVCGLAALLSEDEPLIRTFRRTLETLAGQQGPHGEIPSNVAVRQGGQVEDVSYGGLVGRVDAPAWFVIGVTSLAHVTGDRAFAAAMAEPMRRALALLAAWEHNGRGLVYVPEGGSWADEYLLSGYELGVQLLRLWALRGHAGLMADDRSAQRARALTALIRVNYWPRTEHVESSLLRHPVAYRAVLDEGPPGYWLAALRPGGYERRFDALANAFAMMLGVSGPDEICALLAEADRIAAELGTDLVPAFWPPVHEHDPAWPMLQNHRRGALRNRPCEYHNGGLWPMVNGFWGLGLVTAGVAGADLVGPDLVGPAHQATDQAIDQAIGRAAALARSLADFNQRHARPGDAWGFYEFGHARTRAPMGVAACAWSAAGTILLERALAGARLPWTGQGNDHAG